MPYKITKILVLALSTIVVMAPCKAVVAAVMIETTAAEAEREMMATGSPRTQRRFEASFSVNSPSQEEVRRTVLKNSAELLGLTLGRQVEATSSEVRNVSEARGGAASPSASSPAANANKN